MGIRELQRHARGLEAADDRAFLRRLRAWLTLLEADPRSSALLADMRDEYVRALAAHRRDEDRTIARLEDMRALLGLPAQSASQALVEDLEAPGRARRLIALMRRELQTADVRELHELSIDHERRHGELIRFLHTAPCGALRRLDWLAEEIDLRSRPALAAPGAIGAAFASIRPLLSAALAQRDLTASQYRQLRHLVAGARADSAHVQERLARRTHAHVQRRRDSCG